VELYLERGNNNDDSEKGVFWQYLIIMNNILME